MNYPVEWIICLLKSDVLEKCQKASAIKHRGLWLSKQTKKRREIPERPKSRAIMEDKKVVPWHWRVLPDSEFSMPDDDMGSKRINVRSCHLAAGLFSI